MQRKIRSQVDNKRDAIRALMKNEKIGGVLRSAYNSPVGSTDRKRAAKLVSIMRKVGAVDGQGGPGYRTAPAAIAPNFKDYSNIVIFPAAPKRISPMDGKGGPGFQAPASTQYASGAGTQIGSGIGAIGGAIGNAASSFANSNPDISRMGDYTTSWTGQPNNVSQANMPQFTTGGGGVNLDANKVQQGSVPGLTPTPQYSSLKDMSIQLANAQNGGSSIPWNSLNMSSSPLPAGTQTPLSATVQSGSTTPAAGGTSGGTTGATGTPSPTNQYSGVTSSAAEAVKNNTGPALYAYQQMLRSLPGMQGVPDEALPYGTFLANQYDALSDALKKEYNLDNLLNAKNSLVERGLTLEGDLQDYITGRDEYLNQTNDMIESYKDKMLTMDMSDPVNAARSQQYLNYLYTLRGRQNKRYIELLDRSMDKYKADLAAASNNYDKALEAYKTELTAKSDLTSQEYEMYFNALSGMYQEIADAPRKAAELANLEAETAKIRASAAADAAKNDSVNWLGEKKNYADYLTDKDGNIVVGDIQGFLDTVASSGNDYVGALKNLEQTFYSDINSKAQTDPGSALQAADKYLNMVMQYKASAGDSYERSYADSMIDNIGKAQGNAILAYGNDPEKLTQIGSAAQALAKGSAWFSYKPVSQEEFVTKFENSLDKSLLDDMYALFDAAVRGGNDPKTIFPSDPKQLLSQLSYDIPGMKTSVALTGSGY